jgi:lipoprotein-anchoring transpeptidase ErfK/SrfK
MRRPPPPLLRHPAIVPALALLAGLVLGGCQPPAGPKPDPHGQAAGDSGKASSAEHKPTHLVLRLGERRLYLVDDDNSSPPESFPVAIGKEGWETPPGQYHVEEMVVHPDFLKYDNSVTPARPIKRIPPGPLNPLGERWIGFAHGEGWTLGFHGTPNPELLGQAVSHGCVRMRNADVVKVYERVQVGTPVLVEP